MYGRGPDLDDTLLLPNTGKVRDLPDVDQDRRLAQPELHQRDEAVPTSQELSVAIGRPEPRDRVIERRGTLVLEPGRDHDRRP